jgi:hypothetical protein
MIATVINSRQVKPFGDCRLVCVEYHNYPKDTVCVIEWDKERQLHKITKIYEKVMKWKK